MQLAGILLTFSYVMQYLISTCWSSNHLLTCVTKIKYTHLICLISLHSIHKLLDGRVVPHLPSQSPQPPAHRHSVHVCWMHTMMTVTWAFIWFLAHSLLYMLTNSCVFSAIKAILRTAGHVLTSSHYAITLGSSEFYWTKVRSEHLTVTAFTLGAGMWSTVPWKVFLWRLMLRYFSTMDMGNLENKICM